MYGIEVITNNIINMLSFNQYSINIPIIFKVKKYTNKDMLSSS